jgi:hypothetical protein
MSEPRSSAHDPVAGPELGPTAEALRRTLAARAAEVEPSHDAYARLAARVAATAPEQPQRRAPWSLARLGAVTTAAIALVVAAGLGIAALGGGDEPLGTATVVGDGTTTTPSPPTSEAPGETTPSAPTGIPSVPPGIEQAPATSDMVSDLTLARSTRDEAASAFLDLLGIDFVEFDIEGDTAAVWTFTEGTTQRGIRVATLDLTDVELDEGPGWIVSRATSDQVEIDTPRSGAHLTGRSELTASGQGSGFESTLDVEVRSATDGSLLVSAFTGGGQAEPAPFEITLPLVGTERAWLKVSSAGGADGVASPFAAVPVSYVGSDDPTRYRVVRIGDDDPDGGLVVRAGPGTSNQRLAVVPAGGTVTRRPGAYPTRSRSTVWWPVTTGGVEGWVASSYLAGPRASGISDAAYGDAALNLLAQAADPGLRPPHLALSVLSARNGLTFAVDGELVHVSADEARRPGLWTTALDGLGGRSPQALLAVPDLGSIEITVDPGDLAQPDSQALAAGYFGGTAHATAHYRGSDGAGRRSHLFFTTGSDGSLAVFGVLVEIDQVEAGS